MRVALRGNTHLLTRLTGVVAIAGNLAMAGVVVGLLAGGRFGHDLPGYMETGGNAVARLGADLNGYMKTGGNAVARLGQDLPGYMETGENAVARLGADLSGYIMTGGNAVARLGHDLTGPLTQTAGNAIHGLPGSLMEAARNAIKGSESAPASSAASRSEADSESAPASSATSRPGADLAPITLTPQRMQSIGVKTGVVERRRVQDEIRTVGNVEANEWRLAEVQVRFSGWIQKVYADATYAKVRQGQRLFTIYSPDLVTAEQEYLLAKDIASRTSQGAPGSVSLVGAATERLKRWQVPEKEIARLQSSGTVNREIEIDSPVSGVVIDRKALPNMYVAPGTKLYSVADLSTVWVYAAVLQNDIGRIKVGDPASITVDAYPGVTFPSRVSFIWPEVDRTTRRARVRLAVPNPGSKLLLGMYVDVRIGVPLGDQLVIPAAGVFQSGTRQIAFVDRGGGSFDPRDIEIGARAGDDFIVLKGLDAGERIVTSANYLIDSESQLQSGLASFKPPELGEKEEGEKEGGERGVMNAPGAAFMAAAKNTPERATLDYASDPATPRAGKNMFRVKLAGADGAAIAGADVTVSFLVPATPSTGMAATRTVLTLNDKGEGLYEGAANIQMEGGTWQGTVLATKEGQAIARKQFTVNAEGGM